METLMLLTYAAICIAIFKIFKIPLNKWTVPTAVLGGVLLIGTILIAMNYNHPYSGETRKYVMTTPIVPTVKGRVTEVPVQANVPLQKGDLLFRIDPTPFQGRLDSLKAQEVSAKLDLERADQLVRKGALSRRERDLAQAQYDSIVGQIEVAQFDLDETDVLAPTQGYVTQKLLHPGMMAVPLPLRPVMVFVHHDEDIFIGWFRQNSLLRLEPGDAAEVALDGLPGDVFSGEVVATLPALKEGQVQPSGDLLTESNPPGLVPVHIRITDPDFDQYRGQIPGGAYGQSAIYTEHLHHVAIIRKILLRMSSWMNYLFPLH